MDDTDSVFDLNEVPETELLDSSIQKGRAQLSVKARRSRPSRSRYRDSVSSTEGDDSLERKDSPLSSARSPLHLAMRGSSPSPDSLLSSRSPAFSFDASLGRRSPEDGGGGAALTAAPRGRYRQLTNATSQEALATPTSSPSASPNRCHSDCRVYMRRSRRPDSEVLVSRESSPVDPGSPNVVFDKKTKRRFLDLGVTLRRSYVRVRKEKTNRLSVGSREPSQSPSRSFVPFSWFEGRSSGSGSSPTPPASPKLRPLSSPRPRRSQSQESALSEEFSPPPPPSSSSCTSPPVDSSSRSSHPYHTLSQSSDEPLEDSSSSSSCVSSWTPLQVSDWLRSLHMDQYVPEFSGRSIDGERLLQLDGTKLKALGVVSSADRSELKRRVREFQNAEKQKKRQRRRDQDQRKT